MKSVVKKDEKGYYIDLSLIRHLYGSKNTKKIEEYSFYKFKSGAKFVAYDKKGNVVYPRKTQFKKKSNITKNLRKVLKGL
jgi:hypothetical protein